MENEKTETSGCAFKNCKIFQCRWFGSLAERNPKDCQSVWCPFNTAYEEKEKETV